MSDYTPSGLPEDNTRGIATQVRDELVLVQTAINSKSDLHGITSVSTTSMSVTSPVTKNFTIETDKELVPGMTAFIADAAAPSTNNMTGTILSYDEDTGAISVSVTSHNGSGTKTSWVIGLSNQSGVTLVSNTFTGHQNFARATVASHPTTADIWNATGNQIDFTGVATVTAFPSAPQAGATRELICAAACSFTAGANMLIDGIDSGSTVTCSANDVVIVRAISASQFRLTRQRYDGRAQISVRDNVVTVHTGNGHASTNTRIRRFSTVYLNTGTAISYADSATLGALFTINEIGLYEIFYQDVYSTTAYTKFGASLNSNQLTTDIDSISVASRIFCASVGGAANTGDVNAASRIMLLNPGDLIRPHTLGSALTSTAQTLFSVRKIGIV